MTVKKAIREAKKLYDMFEWTEIELKDGETEKRLVIKEEGKPAVNLTFYVSNRTNLSIDSVYQFTYEALSLIADSTATTEDELREAGDSIEADYYTSNLTEWLNQSNYHVEYLTEALEIGVEDGFKLLAYAQQRAKEEVFNLVVDYLLEQ